MLAIQCGVFTQLSHYTQANNVTLLQNKLHNAVSFLHHDHQMLTGRRFRLKKATLALDMLHGKQLIPAGAVVTVISGQDGLDRMLKVLWEDRAFIMLAMDVSGTEIQDQRARA